MATAKKTVKKYQNSGKPISPTYKNLRMGVANQRLQFGAPSRDGYGATKEDSALYRFGFGRGLRGEKEYPGEPPVQKMGRWEGQNVKKAGAKPKGKAGVSVKKKMQAGGVASKKVKAPMVDPKGAWTKVQQRNLPPAPMRKGGKMSKKK
jgi:hypothetical protein